MLVRLGIGIIVSILLWLGVEVSRYASFNGRRPTIARDFVAEYNEGIEQTAPVDRAWPLYREAFLTLKPSHLTGTSRWWWRMEPEDEEWAMISEYLADNQAALDILKRAAAKPSLGFILTDKIDLALTGDNPAAPIPPSPAHHIHPDEVIIQHIGRLRQQGFLLIADAHRAELSGDSGRMTSGLLSAIQLADHLREGGMLITIDSANEIFVDAMKRTLRSISNEILFSDHALVQLDQVLSSFNGGQRIVPDLSFNRIGFEDSVQRSFTDDGNGDGKFAPAGLDEFDRHKGMLSGIFDSRGLSETQEEGPTRSNLLAYRAAAQFASRQETVERYEQLMVAYEPSQLPALWEDRSHWTRFEDESLRFWLVDVRLPAMSAVYYKCEEMTQWRDAGLVAIALEQFKRETGRYPKTLDALIGSGLEEIPPDRFDGQPLRYRLEENGVGDGVAAVLYSIGADLTDQGGTPPAEGNAWVPEYAGRSNAPVGDLVFWIGQAGDRSQE